MSSEKVRHMCKQLFNWLSYSRALPLHLGLVRPARLFNIDPATGEDIQEDLSDDELEYAQSAAAEQAKAILEVFSAFERRWRTMSIIFDDLFIRDFHPYLRQSLEAADRGKPVMGGDLRHLNIKFGEDIEPRSDDGTRLYQPELDDLFQWILSLPKLESLAISAQARILDHVDAFPFEKVKFVENRPYYSDFEKDLKFICRCTSATRLRLRATREGNDWFEDIQSLRVAGGQSFELPKGLDPLPNLTFLELVSVTQTLDYLRCLNLPGLRYLAIETDEEDDPEICEVLEDFIRRSQCPLATLKIFDEELSVKTAFKILSLPALRSVRHVTFHAHAKRVDEAVWLIEGIRRKVMEEKIHVPSFALWGSWKASDEGNALDQASGSKEYYYGRSIIRDEQHLFLVHQNGLVIVTQNYKDVIMARQTTQSDA